MTENDSTEGWLLRPSLSRLATAVGSRPRLTRWILAGPGAAAAAVLVMAAMPVWLPAGAGGIDNIVYPLVLAPLIWAVAFLYAVLEPSLPRGAAALGTTIVLNGSVAALAVAGSFNGSAG